VINLRFHIVSLVAVFLALAIGIAVGATVVDQGLVSQSQRRIAALDSTLQERAKTITSLRAEQADAERFAVESEPRMIRGRLALTSVLFISDGTVDVRQVAAMGTTMRSAGATVLGTLSIGRALSVSSDTDLTRARLALAATSNRPETIQFLLRERIIAALSSPSAESPLQPVIDAGFIDRRDPDGGVFPTVFPRNTRVVFLHSPESAASPELVGAFLGRLAEAGTPVVVVGSADDAVVARVRKVTSLAGRISSVDTLGSRAGRVATVYALEDLGRGRAGSYGVADGAERLIPAA
jgi:Copper transport outer membrane protein, MctB